MNGTNDAYTIALTIKSFFEGKGFKKANDTISKYRQNIAKWDKKFRDTSKVIAEQNKNLAKNKVQFQGWAMSIMFFGMALQRTFNTIWKTSSKTFQEVMHSVDGTVTGFDMLEGSMKYLQFTLGDALEPVAAWLSNIVDNIGNWVEKNPELVRGVTTVGSTLGGIFAAGGAGVLAIVGFYELYQKIQLIQNASFAATVAVQTLKAAMGAAIILAVGFQVFGKGVNEAYKTVDWISNLGLAAIGGYMLGGPWGALAAFMITLVVMASRESMRQANTEVAQFMEAQRKLMSGEILTAAEANKINFQGTISPQAMLDYQAEKNTELMRSLSGTNITDTTTGETTTFDPIILRDLFKEAAPTVVVQIDSQEIMSGVTTSYNSTIG